MQLNQLMNMPTMKQSEVRSVTKGTRQASVTITHNGRTQLATEWAKELDIPYNKIMKRIHRGYSSDEILSKERAKSSRMHELTYKNKTQTIADWAREIGVSQATISYRVKQDWPIEQILYPGNLASARKQANHYWNK